MNPKGSMTRKLKNDPQSHVLLRCGNSCGNTMAGRHQRCPGGVPCNIQSKEETGKRERPRTRCQGPARGENMTMMVLMMMMNDDNDILWSTEKIKFLLIADIWAIGCIFAELLTAEPIFLCRQEDI